MHAKNKSYPVEIGVQGQCTISCRLFRGVHMVHAVKGRELVNYAIPWRKIPMK